MFSTLVLSGLAPSADFPSSSLRCAFHVLEEAISKVNSVVSSDYV